jgi:hypothetical protein
MSRHGGSGRFAAAVLAAGIAALVWAADGCAQGIVADLEGEVRVGGRTVASGERVSAGEVVSTGAGARAVLHFDDDQRVLLHGSTQIRIVQFDYRPQVPAADRAVFELLRGVLRIVTGALGHRSPAAFELRTDSMIVGVRGTDFLVAVVDRGYLSVLQGTVTASNDAGTAVFEAGKLGVAAGRATPVFSIAPDALPGPVASAFEQLGALRVGLPEAPAPAGSLKPPAPTSPDAAAVERDTARRAHELKKELDQANAAKDAAAEALEHAKNAGKAKKRPK